MISLDPAVELFRSVDRPIWVVDGRELRARDVDGWVARHRGLLDLMVRHERVAIGADDPSRLVFGCVALFGRVPQVLLISRSTDRSETEEFLHRTGTTLLVSDTGEDGGVVARYDLRRSDPVSRSEPLPAATHDSSIIIPTSGTTGRPKLVPHTLSSLTRTTRVDPERGRDFRWGLLYEVVRFAGLQVFLQSLCGGSTLILTSPDDPLHVRLDQLVRARCNALSATPTMWRKLLMLPRSDSLSLRQITLGGEIVDDAILKAVHRKFPAARVTHIYASTEAGVGFAVNDLKSGFPAAFLEHPPSGVSIRVNEEGVLLLKAHRHGARRNVDGDEPVVDDEGFIDTGDLVKREEDRFVFLGRVNGAINVGGNKVQPEEVERVLLQHPGVEFAKVGPIRSSMVGELVQATVQPKQHVGDHGAFTSELIAFCAERLEPYKVPSKVVLAEEFDLNASGKMARSKT